jgi:PAS domain S-box-containing protein
MKYALFQEVFERIQFFEKNSDEFKAQLRNGTISEKEILDLLVHVIEYTKVLHSIIAESQHSIFVADHQGITLLANKAFERLTGIAPSQVIGKDTDYLLQRGMIRPSAMQLVLQEKQAVSILQLSSNGKESLVNAVPVYDDHGAVELVVANAQSIDDIRDLNQYIESKNQKPDYDSDFLISSNPIVKNILVLIDLVKDTDATILISGESGVGKGIFSRYIHEKSNRSKNRLIEINCGAIPEHLLESELFGYEGGAFTGANKTGKKGLIELADGGTLLLDEISELPLQLQVKLLKVIQEKKITRIGGSFPMDVDIRIIAASNKNLAQMVEEGTFRADLFYRLNVIPIHLPALRERKGDLENTIKFFAKKFNRKYNKTVGYSESFLDALNQYDWPGNIRELENYIERKILTNRSGLLVSQDAMDILGNHELISEKRAATLHWKEKTASPKKLEDREILALYHQCKSSYKVAEMLGISQSKAYRKIRKAKENREQSKQL